ncbi:Coiled-coil domain-containing protein 96 [Gonapodya sp. JEL0774]|nr:Coiled-coil domain-containing protein 96 [Gonapodya sp. JEL0774]
MSEGSPTTAAVGGDAPLHSSPAQTGSAGAKSAKSVTGSASKSREKLVGSRASLRASSPKKTPSSPKTNTPTIGRSRPVSAGKPASATLTKAEPRDVTPPPLPQLNAHEDLPQSVQTEENNITAALDVNLIPSNEATALMECSTLPHNSDQVASQETPIALPEQQLKDSETKAEYLQSVLTPDGVRAIDVPPGGGEQAPRSEELATSRTDPPYTTTEPSQDMAAVGSMVPPVGTDDGTPSFPSPLAEAIPGSQLSTASELNPTNEQSTIYPSDRLTSFSDPTTHESESPLQSSTNEQRQAEELAQLSAEPETIPNLPPLEEKLPPIDREDVVRNIRGALDMRDRMRAQGMLLQNKLSEYFRKKRTDDGPDSTKTSADHDQRYSGSLSQLQALQSQLRDLELSTTASIAGQTELLRARQVEVSEAQQEYARFKRTTALGAESARTGEQLGKKAVETLEAAEARKEAEVATVRLENIKLRNRLRRQEALLRQKEELADGLHLIDFEQLKIENQTYNEKIEERNEELLKLRKKITNVVQVLTHVKEKLHFVQNETVTLRSTLSSLDDEVNIERDVLPVAKHEANQLRKFNSQLRQRNGLLGNVPLLRDFERKVVGATKSKTDESESLQRQVDDMKELHRWICCGSSVHRHVFQRWILPSNINNEIFRVKRRIAKAQVLGYSTAVKM